MKQRVKRRLYFGIMAIIILLPISAYVINFRGYQISDEPDDWASFGSYIGGVYSIIVSVLVLLIGRQLEKKDRVQEERRDAIKSLYEQVQKICNNNFNLNSVNKLYTDATKFQLNISETTFNKVIKIADYFQEVKGGYTDRDVVREKRMLEYLKNLYDE